MRLPRAPCHAGAGTGGVQAACATERTTDLQEAQQSQCGVHITAII